MKSALVAERLREEIASGRWPVGMRLPTEPHLAETYAVGLNTVRRAVGILVAEGVVDRRQGSGTYVTAIPARSAGSGHLVGVLVPSTSYYYPRVIEGIERVLAAAGAGVILASSEYRPHLEGERVARLLDSGAQGLILVPNLHVMDDPQAHVDSLRELPVPYILAERRPPSPDPDDPTSYVVTNHAGGVYAAMRHLVRLGHTRIGHLGRVRTGTGKIITDGYERAVQGLGTTRIPEAIVAHEEWAPDGIFEFARACRDNQVTAVFCHGDRDAATLLASARRLGMRVPDDLALVTYDDEVAELGDPPLTAVAPPKGELGALAAELLLRRLTTGPTVPPHRVELQPRLIVRASCGATVTSQH